MIYVCVPVHNEAKTAGLVLWKVRQVFTAFSREYQLLVCDDASTDGTAEVLARYERVLPMTVITHRQRQGYARSLEELLRLALQRTDRPKRDCAVTLHADFVHAPDAMEEMVKRLESGADLVVAEHTGTTGAPSRAHRWARRWAPRLLPVRGVRDTISGFVALRLVVLRQSLRQGSDQALLTTDGWCANAEFLAHLVPHARRLESVSVTARYDLHQRPTRVRPWQTLLAAWHARAVIRAAGSATATLLLAARLLAGQGDSVLPESARVNAAAGVVTALATVVAPPSAVPFKTGERMRYQAKFGIFSVGEAWMEVLGVDSVRGDATAHFRFRIRGGALWYHLDQTMESWVGQTDFRSRRFTQDTEERGKKRYRHYEIFPDSGYYREEGQDTTYATVEDPLDDMAFFYWLRTVPLEIGRRYEYRRYFRPDRNPVIVQVLKREQISVAGRRFNAIVVKPVIPQGRGILAEKADARVWLSDDDRRLILKLQSNFSFGNVTLSLKEFTVPVEP